MELEDMKLGSTKFDLMTFKRSVVWHDIKSELLVWKEGFEMELRSIVDRAATDNPSTASVLLHMGDLNGRIKAVDYLLAMPDVFLQMIEEEQEQKE
jgi:predicted TIM-barrel fold metal-dependent hydrolase